MPFVHPLLLGGLLLIGIPVLIHLVMRQKPKHLLFPAFRFLLQRHRTNQRKLRLRHLVLLALRMLLIALICFALVRPELSLSHGEGFWSTDRPAAIVLLFDTSYSMEYKVGERSRLDVAKEKAKELLDDLPAGSRVAIFDGAEAGGEWLPTVTQARDRIAGLRLRHANAPLTRQINQAYRLLTEYQQEQGGTTEALPRLLYVFSDRTRECWDTNDAKSMRQPDGVHTVFLDVGLDDPADWGIVDLKLPRPAVPAGGRVEIQVTVRAVGADSENELICTIDGEVVERRPVKGRSEIFTFERDTVVRSRPGDTLSLAPGWHQVEVKLKTDDSLPFNNTRFATFEVRGGRRALVLVDEPRDALLWAGALQGLFPCDVKSAAERDLTARSLLANYKAVCLLNVAKPSGELWSVLKDYVEKGGGLAIIPGGENLNRQAYNDDAVAKQLLPAEWIQIVTSSNEPGVAWGQFDSQHPLIAPFHEWRKSGNWDFNRPERLPRALHYWEVKPGNDAQVLVSYADEPTRPALVERKVGQGRVLLLTTSFDDHRLDRERRPWNNYWKDSSFAFVFINLLVGYLAGDTDPAEFNFLSGQTVPVDLPTGAPGQAYTLQGPALTSAEATITPERDQARVQLARAVTPGNYKVIDRDGKVTAGFSINVRPEESDLSRVPVEEIETLFGPRTVCAVDQGTSLREALQEYGGQGPNFELFPWLMIGVLLVLAVENLLANKFYRRESQEQGTLSATGQRSNDEGEEATEKRLTGSSK